MADSPLLSLFSQHEKQKLLLGQNKRPAGAPWSAAPEGLQKNEQNEHDFMKAPVIRSERGFDVNMSAMIIYDKCDLAKEAMTLLERVAHRTDESMQWSVKPWRADLLRQSPTAEAALAEAAEAHLILLALRPVHALLPWLVDWLVRWAKCRRVQDAALAVWEGGNTDTSAERAAPELLQFTGRYGLSLIFDDNPMVQDKSSRFASGLPEREVSLTPTLQNNLEQPARDYYQHWGINE